MCASAWLFVYLRASYKRYVNPCRGMNRPRGFQSLRLPDFNAIGTWKWQCCQPYAPTAFTPQKLFLIAVRGWVEPRATVRPQRLCQCNILPHKQHHFSGSHTLTRDFGRRVPVPDYMQWSYITCVEKYPHMLYGDVQCRFYPLKKNPQYQLSLILLTWKTGWAPNNGSRWQMGFNSAFKGLNTSKSILPWQSMHLVDCLHFWKEQNLSVTGSSWVLLILSSSDSE